MNEKSPLFLGVGSSDSLAKSPARWNSRRILRDDATSPPHRQCCVKTAWRGPTHNSSQIVDFVCRDLLGLTRRGFAKGLRLGSRRSVHSTFMRAIVRFL